MAILGPIPMALVVAFATLLCVSASSLLYKWPRKQDLAFHSQAYILENQVTHARLLPAESTHSFTYPTISLLLSLNALESNSLDLAGGWIFGYGGKWGRLTGLRSKGYLTGQGETSRTIKDKLIQVLADRGHDGSLLEDAWIMTMPSLFGWEDINPLTVYLCYKPGGVFWIAVLEVHNTFGEAHVYLLDIGVNEDDIRPNGFDHQWTFPRAFHVSPFNDRSGFYRVSIKSPSHPPTTIDQSTPITPPRPAIRIHLHTDSTEVSRPSEPSTSDVGPLKLTALLRPTTATPLTTSSLLSALSRLPFALLLSFPRILYQAKILHYKKRLDVFIRPEPYSVASVSDSKRLGGGIKWQNEGLLEQYTRGRVEYFLAHRADETGITIELVPSDPSLPRRIYAPSKISANNNHQHLTIHYLSPRFFTILFQSPSAAHAYLLGGTTERIFTANSVDLFLAVFSKDDVAPAPPSSFTSTLSIAQRIRIRPITPYLLSSPSLSVPSAHTFDSTDTVRQLLNVCVLCTLLFLDNLEKWIFKLARARIVSGGEPWRQWQRAEEVSRTGQESRANRRRGIGSIRES